jgi:hypothetical protein
MDMSDTKTNSVRIVLFLMLVVLVVPHILFLLQPFFMDEKVILMNVSTFVIDSTIIPQYTNYPTLYSYLTAPFILLGLHINQAIGGFSDIYETYRFLSHVDPRYLIMPARVISLILLVTSAVVLARFCWNRYGAFSSLLVFILLMVSPAFLKYASYGLPDVCMMFFSLVSLVYTAKFLENYEKGGLVKYLLLASLFSGLAISTKYSALSTVLPVGFSVFYLYLTQRVELKRMIVMVLLAAGSCVLAFLLGSPGWLLEPHVLISGVVEELEHAQRGHLGFSGVPVLGNIELLIVEAPVIAVSGVVGFLLWLKNKDGLGWIALVATVSAIVLAGGSAKQSLRYMYPAFVGLLIFSAVLGKQLEQFNRAAVSVILVAVLTKPFIGVYKSSLCYLNDNTTILTTTWMYENIPQNSKVASDWAYVPKVYSSNRIEEMQRNVPSITNYLKAMHKGYDITPFKARKKWLEETDTEYIVLSESTYKRFFEFGIFTRTHPSEDQAIYEAFQLHKAFYEALFKSDTWVEVFSVDTGNGPLTHVFQRRRKIE